MSRAGVAALVLTVAVAAVPLAGVVQADTTTSLGDRSGEGGTPFTGLALAPEANLFTGALTTEIAIKVPPGRKDMTPRLALRYSSARGASPFGRGWDLPIGRIERSTKWGVPRCTGDHTDDFILRLPEGGAIELVQDPPGSGTYRPVVEGSYVEAQLDSVGNHWTVRDRSGLRYEFGQYTAARISSEIGSPVLAENADGSCSLTSAWTLTHIEDANGNDIDIEWITTDNVPLPSRILYGGNSNGIDHFFRVQFSYLLRPPADIPVSHRLGVEQATRFRLVGAAVYVDVPQADTIVRSYQFHYFDDGTTYSLLRVVSATGEPTQSFVYTPASVGHRAAGQAIAISVPSDHPNLREWNGSLEVQSSIIDMNGDGKLDLVSGGFFPWTVHFGVSDGSDSFGFDPTPVLWSGDNGYSEGRIRNVWINTGPCDQNGWACTVVDTFDITGDGRTDYIVATDAGEPWRVFAGEMKADGSWGFSDTWIDWPAPDRIIRRTKNGGTFRDTIDINGDGLPDLVDVTTGQWLVWINDGLGFAADPLPYFPAPLDSIAKNTGGNSGSTTHMVTDFDGDGLVDLLEHVDALADERCDNFTWDAGLDSYINQYDCLLVYRNTGQGFAAVADVMPLPVWSTGLTVQDHGEVIADLVDINGDGLPDWVEQGVDGWRVLLNHEGRLTPVAYAAQPPYDAIAGTLWPGGSGPLRKTVGRRTEIDLIDMNGDGFLDRVVAGAPTWNVQLNSLRQPPELLSMMENGLGGTNTIVYAPTSRFDHTGGDGQPDLPFVTWVVAATRLNDGLCTPPPGADVLDPGANPCIGQGHELVSTFAYQDGRLAIEYELRRGVPVAVLDRGFFGFRRVTKLDLDGNETVSIFGQGRLTRGRLLELYYYAGDTDSGSLVRYEVNEWASRSAGTDRDQVWLERNSRYTFDLAASPRFIVSTNKDVDGYGNVLRTSVIGSGMREVETFTEYASPFGSNGYFPYDKPSHVRTIERSKVLDEKRFEYDGAPFGIVSKGNVTKIESWLDTEGVWVATENEYDGYGNLVVARDANGGATTIDYDEGDGTFLYPSYKTNPVGHRSGTVFDYRYGRPAVSWGANGLATATLFTYDSAGRLICETRPGSSGCAIATTYTRATAPGEYSKIAVELRQSGYATGRTTTTHFDALGRERFADVRAVVDGAVTIIRRNRVEFDRGGRVAVRYYPYPSSGSPTSGSTSFDYHLNDGPWLDPLGRLHRTIHPDGTTTRVEYYGERVVSFDELNLRSERVLDAKQRVLSEETYDESGPYSSMRSVYDGMGRLLEVYQNDSNRPLKRYTYDTLGRRIKVVDRDSGTWTFGYDHAGNLLYRDDPKDNQHVQYCYDAASRPVRVCGLPEDFQVSYPCQLACDADETRYSYDDPSVSFSAGRLTKVTDEAGVFRVLSYDIRGRQTEVERAIVADGQTTIGQFGYAYNDTDEVVSIRYPDGEVVTTTYDEAGQPIVLQNEAGDVYVSSVWYDQFGRATSIWHGNGTRDDRSYHGPAKRHRLATVTTSLPGAGFGLTELYEYDKRGQIVSIGDFDTSAMSNSAVYEYDHLGRLTSFNSSVDALDRTYTYDSWGNMTRKGALEMTFGNPLRGSVHQIEDVDGQPIAYDANGNRVDNGVADDLYVYDAEDRLDSVSTSSGASVEFAYDHEGKRRVRIVRSGGSAQVTRYYNDLIQTTPDRRMLKSYFLGGVRVATRTGADLSWQVAGLDSGLVRVASSWHGRPVMLLEIAPAGQTVAVLGTVLLLCVLVFARRRGSRRVVGIRVRRAHAGALAFVFAITVMPWPFVVRPASAQCGGPPPSPVGLNHFHTDHLGSTMLITDQDGAVVEQIRYMPYGEVRGRWDGDGNPIGQPGPNGLRFEYTGHERDLSTGLVYAGARFYDPLLGAFLTPDPAGEFANPYSYVGWDPVNGEDPSGECELLCFLLVTFAVGFVLGAAKAAIDGANLGESLEVGLIGGATSVVTAGLLGPAGEAVGTLGGWAQGAVTALRAAAAGYGVYNTVESFRGGEYAAGSLGALQIVAAAFGGLSDSKAGVGAKPSSPVSAFQPIADTRADSSIGSGFRLGTLSSAFPAAPSSGTAANVRTSTLIIFGIKVEVGTAWAIDSAGNKQIFDVFSVGLETEVLEIAASQGVQLTDAGGVSDLAGTSTSIGGAAGPSVVGFGAEYNVGTSYSGVTIYGSAQYGLAPVGAYGLRETWTVRGE